MINIQALKKEISQRLSGIKEGFFVTIDSPITLDNTEVTKNTLEDWFSEKALKTICNEMNRYVFGRAFARQEKRMRICCAIEIGKETRRLHAHLVFSYLGGCRRTLLEFRSRLSLVCKHLLKMYGASAIKVEAFDRMRDWVNYFVKQTRELYAKYAGFCNVVFY